MSLSTSFADAGNLGLSLDATSGSFTAGGTIQADVPVGSNVVQAFLYASATPFGVPSDAGATLTEGGVSLDLDGTDFTPLGVNDVNLEAYRVDVTDFVAARIGDGSGDLFAFTISELDDPSAQNIDGYALVVVYENRTLPERTIVLNDGFSDAAGDSFTIGFAEPADLDDPDFQVLLSLGIGFGFQPSNQISTVDVNGVRLTSSAGGQDDGANGNGGLITLGGIGDDPANPTDPQGGAADIRTDDELYDLTRPNGSGEALIADGDTAIVIDTANPSFNDNIFFAGFQIGGVATFETPENDPPLAIDDDAMTDADMGVTIDVTDNDIDPDGDPITVTSIEGVTVTVGDTVALASGALVTLVSAEEIAYDPNGAFDALLLGENAVETFAYRVSDGELISAPAVVDVTVDGVVEPANEVTIGAGNAPERFLRTNPDAWAEAWQDPRLAYSHKAALDDAAEPWSEVDFGTRLPGTLAGSDMWRGDLGVSGAAEPGTLPQLISDDEALRVLFSTVEASSIELEFALFEVGESGTVQFLDAVGDVLASETFASASASLAVDVAGVVGAVVQADGDSGFLLDSLTVTGTELLPA